jgi:hypothetical protein
MTTEVDNVQSVGEDDDKLKTISKDFLESLYAQSNALEEVKLDDISLGPWSHSKLKVLEKCPLQFYLKYILKVKLPAELSANQDTTLADVGSAAHKVLELIFAGHTVASAYAMAKTEFVPSKLTEELWTERIEGVEFNITQFKDRIDAFKKRHKVKKIYTELRLGVTRDWKPTKFFASDVWMRGVVDFVVILENGDAMIIDWKYGPPAAAGIRNYKQQLDSYKPLINFGLKPIRGATSGVGFIREGEIVLDEFTTQEDIEGKMKNMIEFNVEGAIESTKTDGLFEHRVGNHCKYCEFAPWCKAKKADGNLKDLEAGTKKFFKIEKVV